MNRTEKLTQAILARAVYYELVPTEAELEAVRRSVLRGAPYGSEPWQQQTAVALGLQSSLRSRGRPRQTKDDGDNNEPAPLCSADFLI